MVFSSTKKIIDLFDCLGLILNKIMELGVCVCYSCGMIIFCARDFRMDEETLLVVTLSSQASKSLQPKEEMFVGNGPCPLESKHHSI